MKSKDKGKVLKIFALWNELFTSSGMLAFALFWIAVISGIFLALFYDVQKPKDSLELLTLYSRSGLFFRSLHYWSAQLFLIFSLFHVVEHLLLNSERKMSTGLWLRLTFLIPLIFYVMISGFMLKGDAESYLARRILAGLLNYLDPGNFFLSFSLVGRNKDWQIVYMHHLATATVLILIFTIEHVRNYWPRIQSVLYALSFSILMSVFFPLGIRPFYEPVVKGPWYFLGLQEFLHWLNYPVSFWITIFILGLLFFLLPFLSGKLNRNIKIFLLIILIIYIILSLIGWLFRGESWRFIANPF